MRTTKRITALQARRNLGQLLEEVHYRDSSYIIERAGREMAALVPITWLLQHRDHRAHRPSPQSTRKRRRQEA